MVYSYIFLSVTELWYRRPSR